MLDNHSPIINGLNTSELSLNTSRGRRRRDSQGRLNGKSSSSEEGSPLNQRRNKINNSLLSSRGGVTKDAKEQEEVILRNKNASVSNGMRKKKSDSFVLDVGSIMSELMASSGSELEEDVQSKINTSERNENSRPFSKVLEPPPPPKSKTKNKMETTVLSRTTLRETNMSSKTSPSRTIMDKPPISPSSRKTVSRTSSSGLARANGPSDLSSSSENLLDEVPRNRPYQSTLLKQKTVEEDKKTGSEDRVKINSGFNKRSADGVKSKNEDGVRTSREDDVKKNWSEDGVKSRTRANAIGIKPQNIVSSEASPRKDSDQFDENSFKFRPRTDTRSKDEAKLKRSGSFNMRRQMSGDKALGIFYHNRRISQATDHDLIEDGEGTGHEPTGSSSTPQSPITSTKQPKSLSSVRDSGNVSPKEAGISPGVHSSIPRSPLLSGSGGSDKTKEKFRAEENSQPAMLSPHITVTNANEESSEVSCEFREVLIEKKNFFFENIPPLLR